MKSFKIYINEADYSRFLKKNKNLTDDQKKEINNYFSKENPQAGSTIDWQSAKVRKWTYDDFDSNMMAYKSGIAKKLNKIKVQGSKGTDYWEMKLKTKKFIANIPLNQDTAQYMNSCRYGLLNVNYCIGWGDDVGYWNDHVIQSQHVPIYITNGVKKWVVMILRDNKSYEVWDKRNNKDVSIGNPEPIPDFSIKKELLGFRKAKLYDEIREEFYEYDAENNHVDIDEADYAFEEIITDINDAQTEMNADQEWFDQEVYEIKSETESWYDNEIEEKKEEVESAIAEVEEYEETIERLEDYQGEFDDDPELETVYIDGQDYSESDLEHTIVSNRDAVDYIRPMIEELEGDIGVLTHIRDQIEDVEVYEMINHDEIDWIRTPPDEDDVGHDVSIPSCHDGGYSEYFDLMEEHGYGGSRDRTDDDIRDSIYDARYGDSPYDGQETLSNNDWYHPEIINER